MISPIVTHMLVSVALFYSKMYQTEQSYLIKNDVLTVQIKRNAMLLHLLLDLKVLDFGIRGLQRLIHTLLLVRHLSDISLVR